MAKHSCALRLHRARRCGPLMSNVRRQKTTSSINMQTAILVALLSLSIGLGGAYVMLGLEARSHLTREASASDRAIGWLFWWSFDKGLYDAEGQKLCRRGDWLALPIIAVIIAWHFFLLK